jgi:hypothetical protein
MSENVIHTGILDEFFTSDMEIEALKARLDVGKPGRDGKSV